MIDPALEQTAKEILIHLQDDDFLFRIDHRGTWYVWKFSHGGRIGTIGCNLQASVAHVTVGIFRWDVVLDEAACCAEIDAGAPS